MMDQEIHMIREGEVDDQLDHHIRALLTRCFVKPHDAVFATRRYFNEPCARRWYVGDGRGGLAAHVALHDKRAHGGGRVWRFGGVAEVCVHPEFRGRGWVKTLLAEVHAWQRNNGCLFSVLMGDPRVYQSSGYTPVKNFCCDAPAVQNVVRLPLCSAMVFPLTDTPWPSGEMYTPGPPF